MIKIKHLLLLVLCCIIGSSDVFAQRSARISGTITSDSEGPLMMVNVTERDKNNRIVEATMTDMEGNFSMVVKNTSNRLEISYIGYKTEVLEIGSRTVFNIKMIEDNMIEEIVITDKARTRQGALDILDREITQATQKFNMSEMEGLSFTSVDEALQGQIAGLDVVFNSGDLGSGTQMRLRGTSTINGNAEPLIVVNDNIFQMPEDDRANFDYANLTNESFSELLSVNPEDIEEIQVLKDAASCAVWGSDGANGVIKIKTKRGSRGPTRVNFSYKFKDKWFRKGYNLLNGDDYTMLLKEAHFNPQQEAKELDELSYKQESFSEYYNFNKNTDWVDAVTKHGYTNNYNVNLVGGGEKASFRISGGYSNETGTIIKQFYETFSSRLSLDYYVSDRIKVAAEFAFSYTNNQQNYDGLLAIAQNIMPNMSIYYHDRMGNPSSVYYKMLKANMSDESYSTLSDQYAMRNPVASAYLAEKSQESYSISPQITLEYDLLGLEDDESSLKYRGMVYMNAGTLSNNSFLPSELNNAETGWQSSSVNASTMYDSKSLGFTTRHNLIFTPYFGNPKHYLTMSGQFELNTSTGTTQSQSTYGLPTEDIQSTSVGSYTNASTGRSLSRGINFIFESHYSYDSKYALGLTVRGEGRTQFGDDRKWVAYPSVSARWNISDEKWMEWAKPVLSMLSIRPSFGLSGDNPGQEYLMYTTYTQNGSYAGITAFHPEGIRLTNLRASDKREFNLGSDFGFFNDLITGSINYYKSTTYDQLMYGYDIPSSTGFTSLKIKNSGAVENSGWDMNLSTSRIKLTDKLQMSVYFNIGQNFNEVKEMEYSILKNSNPDYGYGHGEYLGRIQIGNPLASIYGFRYKGVYRYSYHNWEKALEIKENNEKTGSNDNWTCPIVLDANGEVVMNADGTPKRMVFNYKVDESSGIGEPLYEFQGGDAIYEDINYDGNINELDLVYLGNSNPMAQGGFGFTFYYKRFQLKTNFTYRWDVDVINSARMGVEKMYTNNNQSYAVNWRWRKDGDITEIPRALYNYGYNDLGSDRYVEDASYLRLSYVQASYSFEPEWLKKYGLRNLSLYVSADNIFVLTKYTGLDPEVAAGPYGRSTDGGKTPRSSSYTLSLSVGF